MGAGRWLGVSGVGRDVDRGLPGSGDHLTALATWHGLLHQDIRKILDEVGPQPHLVAAPSVGEASHAAG